MVSETKPKVHHKTFTFPTQLQWVENRAGLLASEDKPRVRVSSPPAFGGEEDIWTPEDLLVAAVDACTMTTFLAYADRKGLSLVSYRSEAEGVLSFAEGAYRFTKVTLRPEITVESEAAIAEATAILEQSHRDCFIANSIRAEVVVQPTIQIAT